MNVLELFAGSRSIGKVAESYGHNVFSSDINEFIDINYVTNILDFDVLKVPFIPDFLWCSPPCTYFSVASIGTHWNENNTPKTKEAVLGVKIIKKTLDIINYFLAINPSMVYYIENPRGKLRKLNLIDVSLLKTVWYCQYGDSRAKPTDIWTNIENWNPKPICWNGNKNCHHESAPRGSSTGTQGIKGTYDRSRVPDELCNEILKTINKG